MVNPTFFVPLFINGTEEEREFSLFALREMLEALVRVNVGWIESHKNQFIPLARLHQMGARYSPERGTEDWLSIPAIYEAHRRKTPIDCEDWAAARAAELRLGLGSSKLGPVPAKADIRGRVVQGKVRMHAFVRYPDGSVEDPSVFFGMPGEGAVAWERDYPPEMVTLVQRVKRDSQRSA